MIQLVITQTGKSYSPSDVYRTFNDEKQSFKTLKEAKDYLKDRYGNCKRDYIYVDDRQGKSKRVGYIYGFRAEDYSHGGEKWLQQDWIHFYKVTDLTI